jgi:hypothetical protein
MIAWLKRLLGATEAPAYSARQRSIFRYWDGRRDRAGDPLAIHRALLTNFDLEETAKVADVPTHEGVKAKGEIAGQVRTAFGIAPFEAGGLLDAECLELFVRFSGFLKELEAEMRPLPSGPTPTASPASAH